MKGQFLTNLLIDQQLVASDRLLNGARPLHGYADPIAPLSVGPVYIRMMLVESIEEQAAMVCDRLTVANCQVVWMTDLEMA